MIRVLLADDHKIVRDGLRRILGAQADLQVAGEAAGGDDTLSLVKAHDYDVAVIDMSMPGLSGLDLIKRLKIEKPRLRILVLSMHGEAQYAARALKAGAAGYVVKRSAAKEVVEAIRAVHAGQRYLSPRVADVVLEDYTDDKQDDALARLSAREREVLQLLAEGRTGAQIAERLSLSQKTVETYRARLVEKLGIRDLAGLVRFAIQKGLVSLDEGPASPPSGKS